MDSNKYARLRKIKEFESIRMKYSKEVLIKNIQERAKELGHIPYLADMEKPSGRIYYAYFEHWNDALTEAGLVTNKKSYTTEEMILILKEKYNQLGRIPKCKELVDPNYTVYYHRFGSLNNALITAKIFKSKEEKIKKGTKENLEKYHLVFEMRNQGKPFSEIGKAIGVSRQRACEIYKKAKQYEM